MSWFVPIRESGRPAWDAFTAALNDTGPVPCAGRDEWISEAAADRSWAAGHCRGCPLITLCGEAADGIAARVGVWGGRDRTPRKKPTQTIPMFDQEATE